MVNLIASLTPFIFVQATCNALGAYLAEIQSRDEQEFIEDIKTKSNISYYCFLQCFYSLKPPQAMVVQIEKN